MSRFFLAATLLAVVVASPNAGANVPPSFSVHGERRDNMGKLQTLNVTVQSTFYDSSTGGTALAGPYTAKDVMAVDGLFTVTFNDAMIVSDLNKTTTGQLWLEASVGNDTFPRQQVTPGIWALMCSTADNATNA